MVKEIKGEVLVQVAVVAIVAGVAWLFGMPDFIGLVLLAFWLVVAAGFLFLPNCLPPDHTAKAVFSKLRGAALALLLLTMGICLLSSISSERAQWFVNKYMQEAVELGKQQSNPELIVLPLATQYAADESSYGGVIYASPNAVAPNNSVLLLPTRFWVERIHVEILSAAKNFGFGFLLIAATFVIAIFVGEAVAAGNQPRERS